MASAHKLFSMPTNYRRHSLHRLGQPAAAETKLLYYHTQMHLFSCALCYTTLQDDPEIFTADGPPGGQPPYRTAPLFAVETRPLHHHQTPEYNRQTSSLAAHLFLTSLPFLLGFLHSTTAWGLGAPAGRSRGAATGSRRVPCREADGSLQGGGREADGSPGRRTRDGPLQGGAAVEASRGPAGRSSERREARRLATPEAEARRELRGSRGRQRRDWLRRPDCRAVDLLGPLLIPAPARDSFPRRSFPPAHAPCAFPRSRFPPCRTFFDRFRVV